MKTGVTPSLEDEPRRRFGLSFADPGVWNAEIPDPPVEGLAEKVCGLRLVQGIPAS